ncbi:hypothetical protein AGDE_15585 [Angomonas deanei]|nr:hypothetical protein AGDE_15585 [Angomonas deanei]|eukprot:EPY18805.1 hypothetical protein AGDE_15585 [Angomonas deanei]
MKRVSALGPLLESSLRRGKRLQSTATQEESSHPPPARELNFCTHFLVEESENLFGELLQEAVHKHNIHPYIAHQLPPVLQPDLVIDTYQRNCVPLHSTSSNAAAESSQILTDAFKKKLIGDDPVPPVYLNRKQKEWFSTVVTKKLLPYTPTHDPPPLRSTGNKFMSSNLYLEEGESKIRYYKNSDFNDFNLRLMAVNTHKKVPRNFITLAAQTLLCYGRIDTSSPRRPCTRFLTELFEDKSPTFTIVIITVGRAGKVSCAMRPPRSI